jgi:hypothetical protein
MDSVNHLGTERAFDQIESTILPGIALTLEALLDAAGSSPSGGDAARSAELRAIASQLTTVVRQLEAVTKPTQAKPEWPIRISA